VNDGGTEAGESGETWLPQPRRLLVNVADLRRRLGQRRVEPIDIVVASQKVIATRSTERRVVGEITIESIERGVSALGRVTFEWEGDCRRCLEVAGGVEEIEIDEIFQVAAPDDSDIIAFDGDQIDLVPIITDAVALSLPLAPLCRDDCEGPDPDRYPAVTVEQFHNEQADERAASDGFQGDPRWAGLDQLDL
jgi:uncharacterized protein